MAATDIIACLALVASFISLYYQFFHKKEEILVNLTNVNGFHRCELTISMVLVNKGTQSISITECSILLYNSNNNVVEIKNKTPNFSPFILSKDEQRIIDISQFMPDLTANERERLSVKIDIGYVNSEGYLHKDKFDIGELEVRNNIILKKSISYIPHKLSGSPLIESLNEIRTPNS